MKVSRSWAVENTSGWIEQSALFKIQIVAAIIQTYKLCQFAWQASNRAAGLQTHLSFNTIMYITLKCCIWPAGAAVYQACCTQKLFKYSHTCRINMFHLEVVLTRIVLSRQELLGVVVVLVMKRGKNGREKESVTATLMGKELGVLTEKTLDAQRTRQMTTAGLLSAAEQQHHQHLIWLLGGGGVHHPFCQWWLNGFELLILMCGIPLN